MSEIRVDHGNKYGLGFSGYRAATNFITGLKHQLHNGRRYLSRRIPDRYHLAWVYRKRFGIFPNLKKPETFNEKICYRRLYPEPIFALLSDKVKVRTHVEQAVGAQYLIPQYATGSSLTPEMYEALPEQFVMKANHGSGYNLIVRDKAQYPYEYLKKLSDEWLACNYYDCSRELHYKHIVPQLLFEKLLLDEQEKVPRDFKFYCFRRKGQEPVVFVEVNHDRFGCYKMDYYDRDWLLVDIVEKQFTTGIKMDKPDNLDKAFEIALKLSEDFAFARVDLYLTEQRIYFGEITFTPRGGFKRFRSREQDRQWGALFDQENFTGSNRSGAGQNHGNQETSTFARQ